MIINEQTPIALIKKEIKKSKDLSVDFELANRVVSNQKDAVNYYVGEFSEDIVKYISSKIERDVLADYFFFLAEPIPDDNIPQWARVREYKGTGHCSLHTYTSIVSTRHFWKVLEKEKKERINETGLIEYIDYQSLLNIDLGIDDDEEKEKDDIALNNIRKIKEAFGELSERDQLVIRLTILDKKPSLDVYNQVKSFIHPQETDGLTSDQIKDAWTDQEKQTAVSLWKGRAVKRLLKLYLTKKN